MVDMRWKEEREEIVELIYRIQADHDGSLRETEAQAFGPWAMEAIKRARKIRWLASKGAPPVLSITNKGSKALDAALASRGVDVFPYRTGLAARSSPSLRRLAPCCRRTLTSPTRS